VTESCKALPQDILALSPFRDQSTQRHLPAQSLCLGWVGVVYEIQLRDQSLVRRSDVTRHSKSSSMAEFARRSQSSKAFRTPSSWRLDLERRHGDLVLGSRSAQD